MAKSNVATIDGRTARRDRNKQAVLQAVIELFSEGTLAPGVHDVARRSGVSLRSVYRYFEDTDDLIHSAILQYQLSMGAKYPELELTDGESFDDRLAAFCVNRVRFFLENRSVYRAASFRALSDERLQIAVDTARAEFGRRAIRMFHPEIEASDPEDRIDLSIDALSQFETLERICTLVGSDADAIVNHLSRTISALLR